jgi:hypothetical protein
MVKKRNNDILYIPQCSNLSSPDFALLMMNSCRANGDGKKNKVNDVITGSTTLPNFTCADGVEGCSVSQRSHPITFVYP